MKLIDKIKSSLSIQELLDHYGIVVNKKGFINCKDSERTASCKIYFEKNKFKCFSCNTSGDVIDFISHQENISLTDALKVACEICNFERKIEPYVENLDWTQIKINQDQLKTMILEAHDKVNQTDYFKNRGLSEKIIKKCKLGYQKHLNQIIIPYSNKLNYYVSRKINDKYYYKPDVKVLGYEPIWNEAILKTDNIVFVCEGQIDAMSLMEIGYNACAVGGSGCYRLAKKKDIKAHLIVAFDNDEGGMRESKKLCKEMKLFRIYPQKYKDWNEWLVEDRESLIKFMDKVYKKIMGDYKCLKNTKN